ncbi:2-hydroxyacid dehydrogenase [Cryptococcus neoformans Tu401-1]|nr:2-hydroxyacid dehydrogenase [Cryptococcus neoformans var. grubii Bt85]OXG19568.1 2-hydroxyacid dehydrogenase [Cryptococcus neoformans var. grubii Tu401-1]
MLLDSPPSLLFTPRAGTFNFDIQFSHSPKGKVTGSVGIRGIGSALVR